MASAVEVLRRVMVPPLSMTFIVTSWEPLFQSAGMGRRNATGQPHPCDEEFTVTGCSRNPSTFGTSWTTVRSLPIRAIERDATGEVVER